MRTAAAALVVVVLSSGAACGAELSRFFVMGDGTLAVVNAHTDERASVRYRRADGSYDETALARLRHVFRSQGDDHEGVLSLRLIEVLSALAKGRHDPLVLLSGYRSPDYNQSLKDQGRAVAGGSMHTEGLAADLAFPRPELARLWHRVRDLDCCGAGYYAKEGFLHVDTGRPRFWEAATSRVDENLSAGNARLFARTEYDRYRAGEAITVSLHALTVPPIRIAREARLVPEAGGEGVSIPLEANVAEQDGCFAIGASGVTLRVPAQSVQATGRRLVTLATCAPRTERTPESVESNAIELR
jgi:uncharacterized protein YcbK (DUF882 family)